jgi:tyrosinase
MRLHVRKDVWGLRDSDRTAFWYGEAVRVMKARPASDPTSWTYQAAMHGTYDPTPPGAQWNLCQHGSWHFLPWHRWYLYYFEAIVREAVVEAGGRRTWSLPYWNYSRTTGKNAASVRTLPPAFRTPGTAANPLFAPGRSVNGGGALPAWAVLTDGALGSTEFTGEAQFGGGVESPTHFWGEFGQVEQQPHNNVHGLVGGLMRDPNTAAADPVFWLHHANIDRLWAQWQRDGHVPPTDGAWRDAEWTFYDETGAAVTRRSSGAVDTEALGYRYDRMPRRRPAPPVATRGAAMTAPRKRKPAEPVGMTEKPVRLTGTRQATRVTLDARARKSALRASARAAGGTAPSAGATALPARVLLSIDDIEAKANPGTVYAVFVNLPKNATDADREAHLAGTLSFFGIEHARNDARDDHAHAYRVTLDVTRTVAGLADRGLWDGEGVDVSFEPLGIEPPRRGPRAAATAATAEPEKHPPVKIGRVSVFYA